MRRWALVVAAVLAVGLVAAGCSSKKVVLPGVTVNQDGSGGSVSIETKDGKIDVSAPDSGQAKLPDGFPLKVISGAKIESSLKSTSNGKVGYTVSLSTAKETKEVADFYEAELKGAQQKVDRNEIDSDGSTLITLTGDGVTNSAWITVSKDKDAPNVSVAIIWGQK